MRFTLVCNHLRYRTTFDPRTFDQALVKRVAEAKDTAQQFAFDLAEGRSTPVTQASTREHTIWHLRSLRSLSLQS